MAKNLKQPFRKAVSIFFVALLTFAYGVKPLHVMLAHHNFTAGVLSPADEVRIDSPQQHDCSICNFEFCSFIGQDQITLPVAGFDTSLKLITPVLTALTYFDAKLFLLRAPPALV